MDKRTVTILAALIAPLVILAMLAKTSLPPAKRSPADVVKQHSGKAGKLSTPQGKLPATGKPNAKKDDKKKKPPQQ